MQQYLDLLRLVRTTGTKKLDRTGVGTLSTFGHQLKFDLSDRFPLLTTKKLFIKGIIHELLWFIRGETNIRSLQAEGVHIWDAWADENGDLGPVYGHQLRRMHRYPPTYPQSKAGSSGPSNAGPIDQLAEVIESILKNPDSRRHIITLWNPSDLPAMALPPCHGVTIQFYVSGDKLSCQMYQRSADVFLGLPFNIASYSLLTMMIAQVTGLSPGHLIHTLGDTHIYLNHLDQVDEQLSRSPKLLPLMSIDPTVKSIDDFRYDHFTLTNYDCHPAIKAPVAV